MRETIWGPIDELAAYPDGDIAVSWIAHHSRPHELAIMDLETAATVEEALDIGEHGS